MVVCEDARVAEHIRHLSTQAKIPGIGYVHDEIGFNYRMPAICAMLGRAQLKRLTEFLVDKKRLRGLYEAGFADSSIELQPSADWAEPSHWLVSASISAGETARDELVRQLNGEDIGVRPIWTPLHLQAPYAAAEQVGCDVSSRLARCGVSFPSSPTLGFDDVERITTATIRAIGAH